MKKIMFDQISGEVLLAVKANNDQFAAGFIQNTQGVVGVDDTQTVNDIIVDTNTQVVKQKPGIKGGSKTSIATMPPDVQRINYNEIDTIINSISSLEDVKVVLRRILEHVSDKPDSGGFKREKRSV